jgi:predicted RNA-binding Zn ribbon-like protein
LRLVQAFLNSADLEERIDAFGTVASTHAWLTANGLVAGARRIGEADRIRFVKVREALRDVLDARDDGPVPPARLAAANRLTSGVPVVVRLDGTGSAVLDPAGQGIEAALGRILAEVARAAADGNWTRLKICRRDVCRWAFYDHSRNRSGRWCTMAVCGNRTKGSAYRSRNA